MRVPALVGPKGTGPLLAVGTARRVRAGRVARRLVVVKEVVVDDKVVVVVVASSPVPLLRHVAGVWTLDYRPVDAQLRQLDARRLGVDLEVGVARERMCLVLGAQGR